MSKCWFRPDWQVRLCRSVCAQYGQRTLLQLHMSRAKFCFTCAASPSYLYIRSALCSMGRGTSLDIARKGQLLWVCTSGLWPGQKVFKAPAFRLHVNNNKFCWVSGGFISNQHKMLQNHLHFLQMFMSPFVTIAFSWTKIKTAEGCKTILMEFFKRFLWPASCCWRFLVGCW